MFVPFWGLLTGASPVDRGRTDSKPHLLVDATGIPLAVSLTGGNRTQLIPLLEDLHARPVKGKIGRPRQRPQAVLADRGYDHDKHRRLLWARAIKPVIARRGVAHGSSLGRHRWVVERGFAQLHNFRRLRIRYERHPEIHEAFLRPRLLDPLLATSQLIVKDLLSQAAPGHPRPRRERCAASVADPSHPSVAKISGHIWDTERTEVRNCSKKNPA